MKPLLAATLENLEDVTFPVYASPKLDGIRCLIQGGKALSRTLKPIPNLYIQETLKGLPDGLDGELMLIREHGAETDPTFSDIQSAVMSIEGEPNFCYVTFDIDSPKDYNVRYYLLCAAVEESGNPRVMMIQTTTVDNLALLQAMENMVVEQGYEGLMIRNPKGGYKQGRSTLKEGYLMKYKRFLDADATIVGFQERKVRTGTLGALVVESFDVGFSVGSGFTEEQRQEIWDNQEKYKGKTITYKYQELTEDSVPRFPTFVAFREEVPSENQ